MTLHRFLDDPDDIADALFALLAIGAWCITLVLVLLFVFPHLDPQLVRAS